MLRNLSNRTKCRRVFFLRFWISFPLYSESLTILSRNRSYSTRHKMKLRCWFWGMQPLYTEIRDQRLWLGKRNRLYISDGFKTIYMIVKVENRFKGIALIVPENASSQKYLNQPISSWWSLKGHTYLNLQLSAAGLFKYDWPFTFSGH